ncbi:MAG TPA: DUF4406 domain-containing protein [Flavobacteriales bacterium]|nr:DUF4406 domain-containing protein [Flavobacteriales bacterium]
MNIKELVVYLSGPISGREDREAITHFASVENILDPHHIVFNPTLTPKKDTWEEYMKEGISALIDSDCVLMLDGWEKSRGASFERLVAFELRIPIYYEKEISWDSLEN